jgi:pimeloyl-ACP methyl ester carboxylesterase
METRVKSDFAKALVNHARRLGDDEMPPQPLSKVKPNASFALGPGAFPARPHLAAIVAEVIALWSEVELQRGRYLAALLGGSRDGAVAMYLAITSAAARRDALDAASKATLSELEYELFCQAMKAARAVEKERNTFVHSLWGYSDDVPNGLLLVDSDYRLKDMIRMTSLMEQLNTGLIRWPVESIRPDLSKIRVYREADLRRTLRAMSGVHRHTYYLAGLPSLALGPPRDELRLRLKGELPNLKPWP